ncbi:HTH-type transcriptional regulator BhcR [Paracraurococcus ruber]|uniref:IclR family transcriptional regulator n=1 Tax=Paracraurococcus ruber TaxID=77675 RepID=A0ABS1D570_9PROT|nr:HTH-type transcriptional regulator BhcR [Paracraurococcus ruber]MBK1661944.1 IclR family transcriptional regulator [Paracraurococcus ruber]TDG12338.1 IclR family transcriptional regulator [Paracraurococcus ruber]
MSQTVQHRRRGRPRQAPAEAEDAPVQSLDRALALLATLAEADGLTLTDLAGRADLPMSTAYRMLLTLQRRGLAEFDASTQLWLVGVETFRIGTAFLRRRKLADCGRDAMQGLVAACGETANLAVAEEDGVVFVSQVETHEAIRAFFRPGTRALFHASGAGKAILAYRPPQAAAATLKRVGLPRFTERTLTTLPALLADLAAVRERGYAVDDEERNLGMRCVGAPIFNEFGEAVAGLSVSGPTVRVTPEAIARFGPLVRDAAARVTRAIAGRPPAA